MKKAQFGKVCASLRKEKFNPALGRTWSQEDLALETNLSTKLIGQIERGEKVNLHGDTLNALATTFGLTSSERSRFFAMATDIERGEISRNEQSISNVTKTILEGIDAIKHPVMLHDGLYRIVALNSAYQAVYGLTQEYLDSIPDDDPTKFHIVRHIHDANSPVRATYQSEIAGVELNNAIYWRFLAVSHRHDPLFEEIQKQLLRKHPTFSRMWQSLDYRLESKDAAGYLRTFKHHHPVMGLLRYLVVSTPVYSGSREIFMASLLPGDLKTHAHFNELIENQFFSTLHIKPVIDTL